MLPVAVRAEPAAIIEDISAQRNDYQAMDFLDPGATIKLQPGETLLLGYLGSCIREAIRGGSVTIGTAQSTVHDGEVSRESLACEGRTELKRDGKKRDAGAVVFRVKKDASKVKPKYVVHGLSPIVHLTTEADEIIIFRLDGKGEVFKVPASNGFADLAKAGIKLKRNVSYRLEAGDRATTFRISIKAAGRAALISRLLRF